ncbi:MAG: RNA polymerase sigma factor [Pseudomonadota bacterium]
MSHETLEVSRAPQAEAKLVDCNAPDPHQAKGIRSLYEAQARRLTHALRRTFGSGPPDPEDITQLAFQKLLERKTRDDIQNVDAFLWRTARNLVLKVKRSQVIRSKYDFEVEEIYFPGRGDTIAPERVLGAKQELFAINETLKQMPKRRRQAFILNKVEGYTITEVARQLGIGRSAAHRHVVRAVLQIDAALACLRDGEND